MTVDIVLRIRLGLRQVVDEVVFSRPTPVVGPEVDITIVDIFIGTDTLIAIPVVLTAPRPLAADGNQMVRVETAYEGRCLT